MQLGDEVKDVITGFTGIVMQRNERLMASPQCAVQAKERSNGIPVGEVWFDEKRLELVTPRSSLGFIPWGGQAK